MLRIYGSHLCPDSRECRANMEANGVGCEFIDVSASLSALAEFLALRDSHPAFGRCRQAGEIGLPAVRREDGSVTLDWKACLAERGSSAVRREEAPVCSMGANGLREKGGVRQ